MAPDGESGDYRRVSGRRGCQVVLRLQMDTTVIRRPRPEAGDRAPALCGDAIAVAGHGAAVRPLRFPAPAGGRRAAQSGGAEDRFKGWRVV